MKMSDVFELPVSDSEFVSMDASISIVESETAAHAINNHDLMKELLQQAAGRVVISKANTEELEWLADTIDVLDGDI